MIIDSLRTFLKTCPLLNDGKINVDYLGVEAGEYSIDVMPDSPIVKRYADGGTLRQVNFIFGSRKYYGADVLTNLENSGFYEEFSEWIENQNVCGTLPSLEGEKVTQKIECLSPGYLFDNQADLARYQIQMRLTYFQP